MNPEQLQQALANLRGIHDPAAVGWWPLAIGWWILLAILVLLIVYCILKWVRHRRANRYRTIAEIGLRLSFEQWQENADARQYLHSANALLKRSILHINQTADVASSTGSDWGELLNQHAKKTLPDSAITALTQECYQAQPQTDVEALHQQLLSWLKSHVRKPKQAAGANHA